MQKIAEAIREALVEGELPCASAFVIAQRLGVEPLQVGMMADELGVRLSKCQLGLFGYGAKAEGKHRRVKPMQNVPAKIAAAIRAALGKDGKLSCAAAWQIAEELKISRQQVSDAAEGLGVRIGHCQLGAF
ncbi:MAG: hypothetical protein ACUVR2_02815 [Anaerolineae bacterium]